MFTLYQNEVQDEDKEQGGYYETCLPFIPDGPSQIKDRERGAGYWRPNKEPPVKSRECQH